MVMVVLDDDGPISLPIVLDSLVSRQWHKTSFLFVYVENSPTF